MRSGGGHRSGAPVMQSNLCVVLVESGDEMANDSDQILYEGEVTGDLFTGLTDGRVRGRGAATRRWFGQGIRLDDCVSFASDLE